MAVLEEEDVEVDAADGADASDTWVGEAVTAVAAADDDEAARGEVWCDATADSKPTLLPALALELDNPAAAAAAAAMASSFARIASAIALPSSAFDGTASAFEAADADAAAAARSLSTTTRRKRA
jgi:hypothetical protein